MTKSEMENVVSRSLVLAGEQIIMSHMVPENDYGFVITTVADQGTNSLRRYHVMETYNEFDVRCVDMVQIDTVEWKELWNTFYDSVQ